jgi:hypothetical protein
MTTGGWEGGRVGRWEGGTSSLRGMVQPGLSYWASEGLRVCVIGRQAGVPVYYTGCKPGILGIFSEYSLKIPRIYSNMIEYLNILNISLSSRR